MGGMHDEQKIAYLKAEISDIEKCLAGDPTSRRFREMNVELERMKGSILAAEQRLVNLSIPGVKEVPDKSHKPPFWWEVPSYR